MYKYIKPVSKELTNYFAGLLVNARWKEVRAEDRLFYTYMIDPLPTTNRSFFLKIPPGGEVHRHIDTPRPENTYHIPLETNKKCLNYTYNPDTATHLEVGKVYEIDRQVEHESVNNGTCDRVHLIIETNVLFI